MRLFGQISFYFLAFGVAGYALFAYGFMPLGALVHPAMKLNYEAHPIGIYLHVFAALVALTLSPFQFSSRLRSTRPYLHRVMGRLYLGVGVTVGGLAGLYMAQFAFGGWVGRLGFACLAIAWMFTGLRAYLAIRRGAVQEHRKWMVRNVSLTLAAVTLRLYLPTSMIASISFDLAYPAIAWLCWVPNLLVAEWFLFKQGKTAFAPIPLRAAGDKQPGRAGQ